MRAGAAGAGAIACATAGAAALWYGVHLGVWQAGSPLAGFFPALSGAILCLFSLAALPAKSEAEAPPAHPYRVLGYTAGLLAFALLMEPVGALPMIAAMFLWLLLGVERMPLRPALLLTGGATGCAWLLFEHLLQVPLPRGIFS